MNEKAFDPKILAPPVLLAAIILFYALPEYQKVEYKTRYPDFQGLTLTNHSFNGKELAAEINNTFNQQVRIIEIKTSESCIYTKRKLKPWESMNIICPNFNGELSLKYSVGGMTITTSGKIPLR